MRVLKVMGVLFLMGAITTAGFTNETERTAKIIDLKGKVEVKLREEKKWLPAQKETTLRQGDILRTGASSEAVLNLDGEAETATVEIKENSQLMLSELLKDEEKQKQKTLLDLALGKILIKAQKLHNQESKFEVKTPTSVVGVRGTTFSVDVEALE